MVLLWLRGPFYFSSLLHGRECNTATEGGMEGWRRERDRGREKEREREEERERLSFLFYFPNTYKQSELREPEDEKWNLNPIESQEST